MILKILENHFLKTALNQGGVFRTNRTVWFYLDVCLIMVPYRHKNIYLSFRGSKVPWFVYVEY